MAQNLDPSSVGRGVLQFKTGLMSVIKVLVVNHDSFNKKPFCDLIFSFSFSFSFSK